VFKTTVAAGTPPLSHTKEQFQRRDLCTSDTQQPVLQFCTTTVGLVPVCAAASVPTAPLGATTILWAPSPYTNTSNTLLSPGHFSLAFLTVLSMTHPSSKAASVMGNPAKITWPVTITPFYPRISTGKHVKHFARHTRSVELPLPLSTVDPPTSPGTYAHFNDMDSFVGKDTHNAQFKSTDGDTDNDH
jgi:hypothetical protein